MFYSREWPHLTSFLSWLIRASLCLSSVLYFSIFSLSSMFLVVSPSRHRSISDSKPFIWIKPVLLPRIRIPYADCICLPFLRDRWVYSEEHRSPVWTRSVRRDTWISFKYIFFSTWIAHVCATYYGWLIIHMYRIIVIGLSLWS